MTPETETSCHYFWASCRNFRTDDAALNAQAYKSTIAAFNEDKDMLEAEQRVIALDPSAPQIDLVGDAGGLQARRLVERLLAAESGARAAAE